MRGAHDRGSRAAFDPPSDFVGDGGGGGGGGRKKLWMGLGIGCGVILLILGGLLVAGGFKALSCCDQFGDAIKRTTAAQQFGADFAAEVHGGELDQAYARTSESFQERISRQAFGEAVASHGAAITESVPRVYDVRARGDKGLDTNQWSITFQFNEPSAEKMVLMSVEVLARGDGEEASFVVDDVRFERKARQLEAEPPAEEVLEIHELLQRGDVEMAYGQLAQQFREQSDVEVFRSFVESQGDLLTNSTMKIREISYPEANRATVVAHVTSASGKNAIVQYELLSPIPNMPGYQVIAISPTLTQDGPADAPAGSQQQVPEQVEGGAAEGEVEPPQVEVDGEVAPGETQAP